MAIGAILDVTDTIEPADPNGFEEVRVLVGCTRSPVTRREVGIATLLLMLLAFAQLRLRKNR